MTSLRFNRCLQLMAGAAIPFAVDCAIAKPTIAVNVSGGVHYSTNPFLATGPDLGAAVSTVSVNPVIEQRSPRSSLAVSGTVGLVNYSRRYSDSVDYGAGVDFTRALTPKLNLRTSLDYDNSASGNNFRPEAVQLNALPSILLPGDDITLLGSQVRRSTFRGAAGFSYQPTTRSTWSLDYSGLISRLPNGAFAGFGSQSDYSDISQTFGYSRQLDERTRVGANLGISKVNYRGTSLGDSRIISPGINVSTRIGQRWALSGGVGMSLVRQNTAIGPQNSNNLSFNASLCRDETRTSACVNAARSVAPSAFGLTRKTTSIGASYNYRLSGRESLGFSGNYNRSDELDGLGLSNIEFYSGSAQYRREFRNRLSLTVDAGFSRATYNSTRSEARAGVGLAYRLGNR